MKSTRTDPHRPGAIIPSDYTYEASYSRPAMQFGDPGFWTGVGAFLPGMEAFNAAGKKWFSRRPGNCDVCGAHFRSGDVWLHNPTGVYINLGYDCADKYSMLADRSEWEAWHRAEKDRRAVAIKERKHAAERDARRVEHADLFARLRALREHERASDFAKNFAASQENNIDRKGWLPTEKQLALLAKLEAEAAAPPKPAEVHVAAPSGRLTFMGEVISIKEHESDWGINTKLTVKVTTPEGTWLAWLTAPAGFPHDASRGMTIEVLATLTPSDRDAHFAFAKRPILKKVVAA